MTRLRLYAPLFTLVGAAAFTLAVDPTPRSFNGAVLAVAAEWPATSGCGYALGVLAALVQDAPELPPAMCVERLAKSSVWTGPLVQLALAAHRPERIRLLAHRALLGRSGVSEALVLGPRSPPGLRRAAQAALFEDARTEDAWIERTEDVGLHGLSDRAAARLYARGEPGSASGALSAYTAAMHDAAITRDVYVGLGTTPEALDEAVSRVGRGLSPIGLPTRWHLPLVRTGGREALLTALLRLELDGAEPSPSAPAVPGADAALDLLYAGEGERGDHVRVELERLARWIARVPEERRPARLSEAVLKAAAPVGHDALDESGDPHAVLFRGAGSPGATVLVARDLALASRVAIQVWMGTEGDVVLRVGGASFALGCRPIEEPPPVIGGVGWRELSAGEADALAYVEGVGRALRRGDAVAAGELVVAAAAGWPEVPGLDEAELAVMATMPPPPPAPVPTRKALRARRPPPAPAPIVRGGLVGLAGEGGALLVSPPWPAPGARREPQDWSIVERGRTLDAGARARIAWWAGYVGKHGIARALLATVQPLEGWDERVRLAALHRLGEPAGAPPVRVDCPGSFKQYPSIWSGASGSGDAPAWASDSPG